MSKNSVSILISDCSIEIGILYTKYFQSMGCEASCVCSDYNRICEEVFRINPDVVLMSIPSPNGKIEDITLIIKENLPETKIIIASYSYAPSEIHKAIDAGADHCILMPVSPNEIYRTIIELSENNRCYRFEPAVSDFLTKEGFPVHLNGFNHLCIAVSHSIAEPDLLSEICSLIYEKIAASHKISKRTVERSLTQIAKVSFHNGIIKDISGDKFTGTSLSNYELICAAADAFAQRYELYKLE